MKAMLISALAALGGFAVGFIAMKPAAPVREVSAEITPEKLSPRKAGADSRPWADGKLPPGQRMLALAEKAAGLGRAEWPEFFRAQLDSPESSRFAARLWAESDPAGFWEWLKKGRDPLTIGSFAGELVRTWAAANPEEAMDGLMEVTDKELGDRLRRLAIDTVIVRDLKAGLAMAARAGDFNRFGWGVAEWMKPDPAAAVKGLADLPVASDYRRYLKYALPVWAEADPLAALEWMKKSAELKEDDWGLNGFLSVAKVDPAAALEAARSITDRTQRGRALGGVFAGGKLSDEEYQAVFAELPLSIRGSLGNELIQARPSNNAADLMEEGKLLQMLPPSKNNLMALGSLARTWQAIDPESGLRWANSLPDPVMRRRALSAFEEK